MSGFNFGLVRKVSWVKRTPYRSFQGSEMEIQPRLPIAGMRLHVEGGSIRLYAKQNRVLIVQ